MSCTVLSTRWAKVCLWPAFTLVLTACGGGGGGSSAPPDTPPPQGFELAGTVVDGPVVDAAVVVLDANGNEVARAVSGADARYTVSVPGDAALPLRVQASGGRDLVTGTELDFNLVSAVTQGGEQTVNLSPISTLAVGTADCANNLNANGVSGALGTVLDKMSMGLQTDQISNPLSDDFTADNIATVVLSNEAIGETVRRAATALAGSGADVDENEVIRQIACDLQDGELDGQGRGADARTTATFRAAELGVALETMAGRLEVNGQDAMALMDDSIAAVMSDASDASVRSVTLSQQIVDQATKAVVALQSGVADDDTLAEVAEVLARDDGTDLTARVDAFLTPAKQNNVGTVKDAVALADASAIDALANRMRQQRTASQPFLSFSASRESVASGGEATLSWASSGAEQCRASEGWSGEQAVEGTQRLENLTTSARYRLTCSGLGGTVSASVIINVEGAPPVATTPPPPARDPNPQPAPEQPAPEPAPEPTPEPAPEPAPGPAPAPSEPPPGSQQALPPIVSLSASSRSIPRGEQIKLRWSSSNADECLAGGAWSGALATRGDQLVGPLQESATFRITCSGEGGNAVSIVSVTVQDLAGFSLSWAPPEENADGTLVTELDGYRIYFGDEPGNYPNVEEINDPLVTSHTVPVGPGSYFVVMTALDGNGQESGYSNEIRTEVR